MIQSLLDYDPSLQIVIQSLQIMIQSIQIMIQAYKL